MSSSFTKILLASALLASVAVPAFAGDINSESKIGEERNVYTNPQINGVKAPAQADNGSQAYAMESRGERASAVQVYPNTFDYNNR